MTDRRVLAAMAVSLGVVAGCTKSLQPPDLGGLYSRAARHQDIERNPVIVIPGILGSKLMHDASHTIVWGAFSGGYADPSSAAGARLLAVPMERGMSLADLRDDVRSDGVLDRARINLAGLPLELNAYVHILATLGVGGYRDELLGAMKAIDYGPDHYTCFQFDYDWRRDNVENAQRLHRFIQEKRAYVQAEMEKRFGMANHDVKFDIIAHSMGGLLSRYYLRYGAQDLPADGTLPELNWAGTEHVERLIMIGTPNGGSVAALSELVDGTQFAAILPKYPAGVLGTMPAIYQLLPRSSAGVVRDGTVDGAPLADLLDLDLWVRRRWGLADPDQAGVLKQLLPDVPDAAARRRVALDHLRKCLDRARHFAAALDVAATRPPHTDLYLFAGDAVPTDAVLAVHPRSGRIRTVQQAPGDGTVTRASALCDLRVGGQWTPGLMSPIDWTHVTFLFKDHLGLTSDEAFSDNVLFILLEDRRPREAPGQGGSS